MTQRDATNNAINPRRLLQPGRNCWRIERAQRFSLLVDADIYFRAVREALRAARHSIFILSWDIDSRIRLLPEGANDGYPEPLGDFLHAIVSSRPHLHAYVLNWDFAMLYALEREWLPVYKLGWRTHRRLAFQMDSGHPVGASHHQKVVVIDDAIAFAGGLDLTRCRWDTPEHAFATQRYDTDGKPYGPFHDVQAIVDGDAALALGDLARIRWERATGNKILPSKKCERNEENKLDDRWPQCVVPDITNIDIAIARTEPAFQERPGVDEIRQLHLDAISAAKKTLFFENQYFTSCLIGDALTARLTGKDSPEIVIVTPKTLSGWLEEATMGVLRARLHKRLKANDRYGRYQLFWPYIPGLQNTCLNVHSKVFTVDDRLFSVGSANLSNRSMAFDTECNLAIEAYGNPQEQERIAQAITRLRNLLLAEHLGVTKRTIEQAIYRHDSLTEAIETIGAISAISTIDTTQMNKRTLCVLDPAIDPNLDRLIPDQALVDPERPIAPDELVKQFVPQEAQQPMPRRMIGLGVLALSLALLTIAWRWTPLRDWVNLNSLVTFAHNLEALPFTPLAIIGSYILAGFLAVPVTLLIAVTGIVFGPFVGSLYAITGTLISATITYAIGYKLGRKTVRKLLGQRSNRFNRFNRFINASIAKRGILTMLIVRTLPIAPFSVVNVVAGASHIRFRDYLIGTVLGMAPGILITVTFVHHLIEVVRRPSLGSMIVMGGVAAVLIGLAIALQRLLAAKEGIKAKAR